MLNQLRSRLHAANFTTVHFTIFSPGSDVTLDELRQAARNVPVYPLPLPDTPWGHLLQGQNNNILVVDSECNGKGRLAYQVVMPWSMLHYPYVKAAILSTYHDNPCGPCHSEVSSHHKAEDKNTTQEASHHPHNQSKLISIVNQYKPTSAPKLSNHSTTAKPTDNHHVGGWAKEIQNKKPGKLHDKHSDVTEGHVSKEHNKKHQAEVIGNVASSHARKSHVGSDGLTTETELKSPCNQLDGELDGTDDCYDPTVKLAPLQALPDGTLPVRVIMHYPHGHKGDSKRYEYLELQLGNPRYHGHLDEHGRRLEDAAVEPGTGSVDVGDVSNFKNQTQGETTTEDQGGVASTEKTVGSKRVTKMNEKKNKKKVVKSKTLLDLDIQFKPRNDKDFMYDKSSDDFAYDHHVDEYNDDRGSSTFDDSERGRKMPWEDMDGNVGELPIVDYLPSKAEEKGLAKTYKDLVPGYDGKLETDEEEEEKKRKKIEVLEDEAEEDEDDRSFGQYSTDVKTSDGVFSEGGSDKNSLNTESKMEESYENAWGTKESVEKTKKVIKPITYDSNSDSSSQGEVMSREMTVARDSLEKSVIDAILSPETDVDVSHSMEKEPLKVISKEQGDEGAPSLEETRIPHQTLEQKLGSEKEHHKIISTVKVNGDVPSLEEKKVPHQTLKKKLGSEKEHQKIITSETVDGDVLSLEGKRTPHHTLKKKLGSHDFTEENINSDDLPQEKKTSDVLLDESLSANDSTQQDKKDESLSVNPDVNESPEAKGTVQNALPETDLVNDHEEVNNPHDSLKKKEIEQDASEDQVVAHYSKLLPWVHYKL